jgi:hypothetical protein
MLKNNAMHFLGIVFLTEKHGLTHKDGVLN